MDNGNKGVWEYLRIATPVLTTLGLFIIGFMGSSIGGHMDKMEIRLGAKIDKLDDKLFKHLTNDDIHAVRSTLVNKAQFDLINQIRTAQMGEIKSELCDLKTLVIEGTREASINATTNKR